MGTFETQQNKNNDNLQAKNWSKLTQFKQLSSGAGASIFKTDHNGVFVGGNKFSTAPFRLDYDGDVRFGPLTEAGLGIDATNGTFDVYWDDTLVGSIEGFVTGGDNSEDCYIKIGVDSGRYLKFQQSMISCNGNFNSYDDNENNLGTGGTRWAEVHCDTLVEGDHAFTDKTCPLCGKDLKIGDGLINYIYKQEQYPYRNISVPAHIECYLAKNKFKPEVIETNKAHSDMEAQKTREKEKLNNSNK